MERRLGQISKVVTSGSESHIKLSWDTVYDIPLLGSLKQQLADEHILEEVRQYVLSHYWCSRDAVNYITICVSIVASIDSNSYKALHSTCTSENFINPHYQRRQKVSEV